MMDDDVSNGNNRSWTLSICFAASKTHYNENRNRNACYEEICNTWAEIWTLSQSKSDITGQPVTHSTTAGVSMMQWISISANVSIWRVSTCHSCQKYKAYHSKRQPSDTIVQIYFKSKYRNTIKTIKCGSTSSRGLNIITACTKEDSFNVNTACVTNNREFWRVYSDILQKKTRRLGHCVMNDKAHSWC